MNNEDYFITGCKNIRKKRRCRRSQCGLCTEHDSSEKIRSRGNRKLQNQHADKVAQENLEKAQELAKDLEGKVVEVKIKTGEGGKIFGSVSTKEIAAAAKEQIGFTLDKKKMQLEEPIRSLGYHDVPIRLHTKVTGTLRVKVTEE